MKWVLEKNKNKLDNVYIYLNIYIRVYLEKSLSSPHQQLFCVAKFCHLRKDFCEGKMGKFCQISPKK
jgi:hypothetical protein